MKILLVTVLAALAATSLGEIEVDDGVLVLTKENFEEAIKNDFILIEFYAPWCGHCKVLAPEYAKAAKELEKAGSPVKLAKVDATVETELAEEHGVHGYPTLKFYRKGTVYNYSGSRKAEDIISWLNKKTGPPAKELLTVEEAKTFIETSLASDNVAPTANNVVIVGFFKDLESDAAKTFLQIDTVTDDHTFGITNNEEIFKEYGVEDGQVVLFKTFDEGKHVYTGEIDDKKLQNFISIYSLPLVVDFNQDTAQKIFSGDTKSHLLVFLSKKAGHYDKYVEDIKEPAKKFREQILFVTINADEADHERILEFFGIKKDDLPTMRIIKFEKNMPKYKPENPDLTADNVLNFVNAFIEDKLKRHLLSQELPEDWDKNPVKVLVGSNFHEVVMNKEKNVLVEFYAPWCGHCQQLAPIYEALGEKYKDNENIIIAKMDATANELEDIKIDSFPIITLYKNETNEAAMYGGERTLEGLSKFIDSNGAYRQQSNEAQEENEDDDVPRKDEL